MFEFYEKRIYRRTKVKAFMSGSSGHRHISRHIFRHDDDDHSSRTASRTVSILQIENYPQPRDLHGRNIAVPNDAFWKDNSRNALLLPVRRSEEYLPRYKLSNPIGYIAAVLGMPKMLSIGPESLTKQAV
jgi:hypothetical protein